MHVFGALHWVQITAEFWLSVGGWRSQGNLPPQTFSSMLSIKILYANESL